MIDHLPKDNSNIEDIDVVGENNVDNIGGNINNDKVGVNVDSVKGSWDSCLNNDNFKGGLVECDNPVKRHNFMEKLTHLPLANTP